MTAQPLTIRASATSAWPECNLRAAVHSFAGMFKDAGWELAPARAVIGAIMGSGYHGGADVALREHMAGSRMPLSAVQDAAIETFRQRYREDADGREVVFDPERPTVADAELQCRRMLARWHADVLPETRPVVVESRIVAEFRPGILLSGQADLLHLDQGAAALNTVRDHKTSRRRQVPMKHAPQLGCYSLLFRAKGHQTDKGQIDLAQVVSLKKPQPPIEPQPFNIVAAEQMAVAVLNDFADKVEAFRADGNPARLTCNPGTFLCSARYCRAHGQKICPATFEG